MITPTNNLADTIWIALDDTGAPLAGTFDVQLRGSAEINDGLVDAVSNFGSPSNMFACELSWLTPYVRVNAIANSFGSGFVLFTAHVTNDFVLRLVSPSVAASDDRVTCRADYGVTGESAARQSTSVPVGGAGFLVLTDPVDLTAILVSRFQPGTPCPPTILR
jgi:hypothetical protein